MRAQGPDHCWDDHHLVGGGVALLTDILPNLRQVGAAAGHADYPTQFGFMSWAMRASWMGVGLLALLAGCGGGGGGGTTVPTTPVVTEPGTTFAFDATVSATTRSRIRAVMSAADSVKLGDAALKTPAIPAGGDVAVIAVDAQGDLLLAGYASQSGAAGLSHESTARFLSRLRLGQLVSAGFASRAAMNAAITASPALAPLTAAIANSLTAGVAPLQSDAVLAALSTLVTDVQATLAPTLSDTVSAAAARRSKAFAMKPLAATPPPLPYVLVPSPKAGTIPAVLLDDLAGDGVSLLNNSLLGWSYSSSDLAGVQIQAPKLLEGISLWSSLSKVIVDGRLNDPKPVQGNGSQFVVTAALDEAAIVYNVATIVINLMSAGFSEILGTGYKNVPTCALDAAKKTIMDEVPALLHAATLENLKPYLFGMFKDDEATKRTLANFAGCLLTYDNGQNALRAAALTVIARAVLVIDIYELSSRMNQLATFSAIPVRSVEICKRGGAVVACSLSVTSPSKLLAAYQSMPLTAMVSASAAPFADPSQLAWELDDPGTLATIDAAGVLTARYGAGKVTVRVSSTFGDTASYQVQTYLPKITPPSPSLKVGQTTALALVDPKGAPAVLSRAWTWSSTQPGVASVDPASGVVTALSVGTTRVIASDRDHPISVDASVVVMAKDLVATTLLIASSPNPSLPGELVTLSATVIRSQASAASLGSGVGFRDGSDSLYCFAIISEAGTGQCKVPFSTAGTKEIVAEYGGNADFAESKASATHTVACGGGDTIMAQGPWGTIKRKGCAALKRGGSVAFTDLFEFAPGTDGAVWGYVNIYAPGARPFSLSGGLMPPEGDDWVVGTVWGSGNADPNCMSGTPDAPSYSSIRIAVPSTYTGNTLSVGNFYFRYERSCYIYAAGTDGFITFPVID